mmetsp:Transcript_80737/g.250607  ORF Transcript_80737/g.250607 Transcript_80737/m.250607 type:complete len:366 (-) Transcript_80737:72-1169(-)
MRVQAVGGQRHEEGGVRIQGHVKLGLEVAPALQNTRLQAEVQPRQTTDALVAVVESVVMQRLQPLQVVVEGAECHEAVAGHVLGLVRVRLDLGLRLLPTSRSRSIVVDLRQDVVEGRTIIEDTSGLLVQGLNNVRVARAEVDCGSREVAGAAQQPEVELAPVLRDRRQVDPGAVSRPGLGRLREGLEGVLGLDPAEAVEARVEEAAVVDAHAMHEDGHAAHVHDRPGSIAAAALRELPDDIHPPRRLEPETAGPGELAAQVHGLVGEAGQPREVVDHDSAEVPRQLREARALNLGEDQQDGVPLDDATLPIGILFVLFSCRGRQRGATPGDCEANDNAHGQRRYAGRKQRGETACNPSRPACAHR